MLLKMWTIVRDAVSFFKNVPLAIILNILEFRMILTWSSKGYENYALMFALFSLVYCIIIAFFWWKHEENEEKRNWSWILVVLQIYPEFRSSYIYNRVIGEPTAEDFKQTNEIMSLIRSFVKDIPQLLVISCFNVYSDLYVGSLGGITGLILGLLFIKKAFFGVLSMKTLLNEGTCRVLAPGGIAKYLGYLLVLFCVTTTFIGKGMALAVMVFLSQDVKSDLEIEGQQQTCNVWGDIKNWWNNIESADKKYEDAKTAVAKWVAFYVAPQLIMTIIILAWNLKTKFVSILSTHIYLLLCPVYTCFSYGPANKDVWYGMVWRQRGGEPVTIKVSPLLTTINVVITLAVHVYSLIEFQKHDDFKGNLDQNFLCLPGLNYYDLFKMYAYAVFVATFIGGFCTIAFVNCKYFGKHFVDDEGKTVAEYVGEGDPISVSPVPCNKERKPCLRRLLCCVAKEDITHTPC